MRRAILWVAFLGAALAGSDAAPAQNVAAPAGPPAPSAAGPIAAIQQQLKRDGYLPGVVNGVMTEQTQRAIAAYERRNGRPPDALAGPGQSTSRSDPIARAQAGLRQLGLLANPPDGVVGPQTRDAIIRFQAAHHLAIDPRVSDSLLAALDQADATTAAAPAAATPVAPPPAASAEVPAAPASPPQAASPEAPLGSLGRRPLPSGVNPPPIR
jgi:peptidoglycan hydrolase-like protein with peptidoglycan-binding domain